MIVALAEGLIVDVQVKDGVGDGVAEHVRLEVGLRPRVVEQVGVQEGLGVGEGGALWRDWVWVIG